MNAISGHFLSFRLLILVLIIFCLPLSASGQEKAVSKDSLKIPPPGITQILTLHDSSTLIGQITEIGDNDIKYKTNMGELTIAIADIKNIKDIPSDSIHKGSYWFENPNATRLYFAPTARMLKKGEGYFSDYYLFFPGVAYGVSDKLTLGGGMSIFPGVDINNQIFFLTPKFALKSSQRSNLAVGALIMALPDLDDDDDDDSPVIGVVYGVGTRGGPDGAITLGLGYGFVNDDLAENPTLMIGGEKRFAKRMSFVSENWILPGIDQPLISYGVRFFGEGLSIDLALASPLGEDFIFPGVPWLDFVFNF